MVVVLAVVVRLIDRMSSEQAQVILPSVWITLWPGCWHGAIIIVPFRLEEHTHGDGEVGHLALLNIITEMALEMHRGLW